MSLPIQYVQRKALQTARWDECVQQAANGLIYGYSWWLDHMARHWDALVWGDYEAVMPLTWNRKWGISYLYQPAFTQQLGIFSKQAITPELEQAFLSEAQAHFRFAEIYLNYGHGLGAERRSNFILPLQAGYEAGYKKDLVKNLKRAVQFDLQYTSNVEIESVLEAYRELYGARTPNLTQEDYARFKKLCLNKHQHVIVRAAREEGQLLSAALMLRDEKRLYLLHAVTWPEGRDKEANHFLLDQIVGEFAGTGLILDFEGSDLPGIAHFYKNFGSIDQPYYFYRYNRLPAFIKWLKQ